MKKTIVLSLACLAPAMALAGPPVKYPTCAKNHTINQVPHGSGVYFDENCDIAYVLPPAQGRLEIKGLAPNMNLKLCPAYESTLSSLNKLYAHLEVITKQLNAETSVGDDTGFGDDTDIDGRTIGNSVPTTLKPIDPNLIKEIQKTNELITTVQSSMAPFENDKTGVAVGKINYFTDWNDLVAAYQKANPNVHFERLPLEAGRIVFGRKLGASGEIVTGAVAHSIFGIENTSAISSDGTLAPNAGSVIMGDAISGQVVLNFAGACPFVKNGNMPGDLSESEVDAYLAANFQYKFSLQSLRTYRASYNMASIAKHIQEHHSKGGFFSSSSSSKLTESNLASDEFTLKVDSNQESFEYESTLSAEVKTDLINRALREMGNLSAGTTVIPSLTPPPPHGATVLAGEVQKIPHIYAQIGAGALRVLDSIFGNSNAVASYIRERNAVTTEGASEKKMFSYQGSTVFTGKKK